MHQFNISMISITKAESVIMAHKEMKANLRMKGTECKPEHNAEG